MVQAVRMPMMGNTMEQGLVTEWNVEEGDEVSEGDLLVAVESEKTAGEVEAAQDGVLERVDVEEGDEVPPGTVLGIVLGPDESLGDAPAPRSRIDPESAGESPEDSGDEGATERDDESEAADREAINGGEGDEEVRAAPGARKLATERGLDLQTVDGTGTEGAVLRVDVQERLDSAAAEAADGAPADTPKRAFASPTTRRLARERDVSIDAVEGTGIGGRVTQSDVRAAAGDVSRPKDAGATDEGAPGITGPEATDPDRVGVTVAEERELTGMRRTIAERMSRSAREAPHVTLNREIDVERALETVEELTDATDSAIGFTDLLIGASVRALDAHPAFNAWFEDGRIRLVEERNVAVAVDVEGGLVTPVIRSAGDRSLEGIATERRRLTDAVLEGAYATDDLAGGTFTITNLGMFGVDSFDPVINPPQVAILGVGRVRDGDGRTCVLSLSFDHRVVDGADAARFLDDLAGGLEAPSAIVAQRSAAEATATSSEQRGPDGTEASVADAVARDLEAAASDVAAAHDWEVPTFDVRLDDGRPTIAVQGPSDASPATMKRLTYAACRESAYAGTIAGIRDPEIEIR